jgi:shikimate dehydrogenase
MSLPHQKPSVASSEDDSVDRYVVIGNPIAHSRSPEIQLAFAAQTGERLRFERLLAPLGAFPSTVRRFRDEGGIGANVTVPFKLEAYDLATQLTQRASLAGAVNTLKFHGKDAIVGDNTDGVGLVRDLERLGVPLRGAHVLLLGGGGSARGVIGPILDETPESLTLANRTLDKIERLAELFGGRAIVPEAVSYEALKGRSFDVVVNATSASLNNESLPVPEGVFAGTTLVYDMMYGAAPTRFLRDAAGQGARRLADGLGMLVEQAAESFYIWRGMRPDTASVHSRLRAELQAAAH